MSNVNSNCLFTSPAFFPRKGRRAGRTFVLWRFDNGFLDRRAPFVCDVNQMIEEVNSRKISSSDPRFLVRNLFSTPHKYQFYVMVNKILYRRLVHSYSRAITSCASDTFLALDPTIAIPSLRDILIYVIVKSLVDSSTVLAGSRGPVPFPKIVDIPVDE